MEITDDAFLGGRLRILQPAKGYRAATDPVFLAAAAPVRPGETVLELGCGVGVAALCLLARVPGAVATGVEIQPHYADLARKNSRRNDLPLTVVTADIQALPGDLRAKSVDHVIANPPFFGADNTTAPTDPGRDCAHREGAADLQTFIEQGLRRLAPGGWLTLIHKPERLGAILGTLMDRAGAVAVLPLQPREGRPAGRVLIRARKGAKGPLTLLAPLVIHSGKDHRQDGNDYSPTAEQILRHGQAVDFQ